MAGVIRTRYAMGQSLMSSATPRIRRPVLPGFQPRQDPVSVRIPQGLLERTERLARRLGVTRTELIVSALGQLVEAGERDLAGAERQDPNRWSGRRARKRPTR